MRSIPDIEPLEGRSLPVARPFEVLPDCSPPERIEGTAPDALLVEADMLIEDVSIDGMCGVY